MGSSPASDVQELYRRIVFNALVGNLDEHDKNHGWVADDRADFHLSPVFDLNVNATSGDRQMLAMPFGVDGALVSLPNLLSACSTFGCSTADAEQIINAQRHIERNFTSLLVQLECAEGKARKTAALMPGNRLFPV